jgi:hypothetical protein
MYLFMVITRIELFSNIFPRNHLSKDLIKSYTPPKSPPQNPDQIMRKRYFQIDLVNLVKGFKLRPNRVLET